jgi:DNA-binding LacI/PurR family transcriptional regulator
MKDKVIKTTKGKAERTAELLREKIRNGELSNEGKIPSIRKLSALPEYGDRNAIWRALLTLKEERYVTTTPAGRYLVHPRFQLNNATQKTLNVAFVGEGDSTLNNAFIQSIHTALAGNHDGYNIQLNLLLVNQSKQLRASDLLSYDAIILTDHLSLPLYKALKQKNKLVTSLVAPRRYNIPCGVQIDDIHGGARAGLAYCLRAAERIVILGESNYYPNEWQASFELRILGFRKSWIRNGKRTSAISEYPLPVDVLPRLKEIERIVDTQDHPVGYFALSDATALMLHSVLRDRAIQIPEEAQIIGFDDHHEATSAKPSLTSLCPDPQTFAEKIVEQLRFLEADPSYSEIVYVKPRLIERESLRKL